ncbi:hypothetical protein SAMN05444123_10726 [Rhodopseudomonas pseudopalustris]|uniref:Uncharacterized protein n=1 Tax=Rhodopseudomonas pseudopalustris TaxID=1513892 RepID=A0A1H8UH92_9BRAD|nr:hypothetical protein SAMN05444123_10726 [Rhodopseudomonas pseudopalustris]
MPYLRFKPLRFRTRNDLDEAQRTRSKSNENPTKSKTIDILLLIAIWMQVRVLGGQLFEVVLRKSNVMARLASPLYDYAHTAASGKLATGQ